MTAKLKVRPIATIREWLQRYCVQYEKQFENGSIASGCMFGGSGSLTRKAAEQEMERHVAQGATARLHKVTVKRGVTTVHYPAVLERKPCLD